MIIVIVIVILVMVVSSRPRPRARLLRIDVGRAQRGPALAYDYAAEINDGVPRREVLVFVAASAAADVVVMGAPAPATRVGIYQTVGEAGADGRVGEQRQGGGGGGGGYEAR